jgi:CopG antitoxin of type II toxin-antitoxin system
MTDAPVPPEPTTRKQSERMRGFQLRLPNRLYADLEVLALRDGRSVANLLRFIAEEYVETEHAIDRRNVPVVADLSEYAPPIEAQGLKLTPHAHQLVAMFAHRNDPDFYYEAANDLREREYLRLRDDGVYASTVLGFQTLMQPPAQEFLRKKRRAAFATFLAESKKAGKVRSEEPIPQTMAGREQQ